MINKRRNHTQSMSKPILKNSTPTTQQSSTFSTLKETVVAGFGLGAGSEIAHRVVSNILGPRTVEVTHSTHSKPLNACQEMLQAYEKCIKQNQQNDLCTDDLEKYHKCIRES